jgi:hypothetical protein
MECYCALLYHLLYTLCNNSLPQLPTLYLITSATIVAHKTLRRDGMHSTKGAISVSRVDVRDRGRETCQLISIFQTGKCFGDACQLEILRR